MRRAGVYVFYDKDGIVDSYVPYFVKELHKVVDYIVVVVNGKLTPEGRKTLVEVSDDMFVRENKGYDSWAYKEGIEYIGWDKLREYDEFVLANSSAYGPVFPFKESFDKMEDDGCDFWGMTTAYESKDEKTWGGTPLKWGYRPDAIASNFLVFKKSVLKSFEFYAFWKNLHEINNYFDAGVYMEATLTNDLRDAGFVGHAMDCEAFRHVSPSPSVYSAYSLLTDYRIPIVRVKAFYDSNGQLGYCTDVPRNLIDYLESNTGYDCNLIWEHLLRTTNLYDLKNWFNLNNILPLDYSCVLPKGKRIATIFHFYYDDIMGQYLHNIKSFPDGTDFYFTTDTEDKIASLRELMAPLEDRYHIKYRIVENRGRDVSALLVGCRDVVLDGGYDLICFMHDKKAVGSASRGYSIIGKSVSDGCFENIAANNNYVNNLIGLFEKQPRLGLAVPPAPNYANYYTAIGGCWNNDINFKNTKGLLNDLKINVPISENKPPVAPLGTVFWFRPTAMQPLFAHDWKYEDFETEPARNDGLLVHAVERSYGFIAQSQGYYTTTIVNSVYAEQELTRMTEIAHTYVDITLQYVGHRHPTVQSATMHFLQVIKQKTPAATANKRVRQGKSPARKISGFKTFMRGICPIGLWNLFRRIRCAAAGGVYVEPYIERGFMKNVIRACTPRFIWDALRKTKCRKNGWIFVED